ncbi:hypothetical protein YC2023_106540 [Brassica napus]
MIRTRTSYIIILRYIGFISNIIIVNLDSFHLSSWVCEVSNWWYLHTIYTTVSS